MKYTPSKHALEQAELRFGIESAHAANWLNQCVEAGTVAYSTGGNVTYRHKGKYIVVDPENMKIVTVKPDTMRTETPMLMRLRSVAERELTKAQRQLEREERQHRIQEAELAVEKSRLELNRLKARNPKVRQLISDKLAVIEKAIADLDVSLRRSRDFYATIERQASKLS